MAGNDQNENKKWWVRGLLLLVLLGGAGHAFYWYWPRTRASLPNPSSQVAGLVLGHEGPEIRMWIPFPHQNLGTLEDRLGDLDSIGRAVQDLVTASQPFDLPSFGPFRVPPATEMSVASGRGGKDFVAMVRVYPVAAWLFRIAGLLADNPWMAGGELVLGGRTVEVEWQGTLWIAKTEQQNFGASVGSTDVGESLMLLRLGTIPGPVPSGLYRLISEDSRMVLTSNLSGGAFSPPGIDHLLFENIALSWTHLESLGDSRGIQSLVAMAGHPEKPTDLPSLMLAETAGTQAWQLPGERVLEVVGAQVFSRSLGSWHLRSYDPESLQQGPEVVAGLEAFARQAAGADDLSVGYIELGRAFEIIVGVAEAIHRVPVLGESESRRWLALAHLLEDVTGISGVFLWIADPDQLELQFWSAGAD